MVRGSEAFRLLDELMTGLDLRYQAKICSTLKKLSTQGLGQLVAKGYAAEELTADNLGSTFDVVINQLGVSFK